MNFKRTILSMALVALACGLTVKPAAADTVLYNNISGASYGFGGQNIASQGTGSFTVTSPSSLDSFKFYAWIPQNSLSSFDWAITSSTGANIASGVSTNFSVGSRLTMYSISWVTYYLEPVTVPVAAAYLNTGTYTLTLSNASSGTLWDASTSAPASLQVSGTANVTPPQDQGGGSQIPSSVVPEPSSLLLLGTGLMGLAGLVKMRLFA